MDKKKAESTGIVYSTGQGRMCPDCGKSDHKGPCEKETKVHGSVDGVVRISRETKGRKGKGVTLITGVPLDYTALQALAKQLKARCGSGGTAKEGVIEIQGEWRDFLVEELKKYHWKIKKV